MTTKTKARFLLTKLFWWVVLAGCVPGQAQISSPGSPVPSSPSSPGGPGDEDGSGAVVALFSSSTALEAATVRESATAVITRFGDRVRDRHARESEYRAHDHFLSLYFDKRTYGIEIVDEVAKGGNKITVNLETTSPYDSPDFRAFFRGINTSAEYWFNADFTPVDDLHHTATVSYNAKEGREIRVGDRMEIEVGVFLRQPVEGRFNYYSGAFLYIVGTGGIAPFEGIGPQRDSFPLPEKALLGGRTTLNYPYSNEPDKRFMQMALNMAPQNAQAWVEGRRMHHTDFTDGTHSETGNPPLEQLAHRAGPNFVARSCVACHVRNGRSLSADVPGKALNQYVVKVAETKDGNLAPHSLLGSFLQSQTASGASQSEGNFQLQSWEEVRGKWNDGTDYVLRRPIFTTSAGPLPSLHSVRATPPLVGLGLLEAVAESTAAEWVDATDKDGNGISGRMQVVLDPTTNVPRMGRFGWKAGQPTLKDQVAAALVADMGVTTPVFYKHDCGASQGGCGGSSAEQPSSAELGDKELTKMARYVALLGVPARRDLTNPTALKGEQLFQNAGCVSCHRAELKTSPFHPNAELRDQTIQPYTDLLLHDMGPGLADTLPEGSASASEWRTPPLWGIGLTAAVSGGEAYLHDGRARTLAEAILWHDGEGAAAKNAFVQMSASDREALVAFLKTL